MLTLVLSEISPHVSLFCTSHGPTYSHLWVFGCSNLVLLPPQEHTKLWHRSIVYEFFSYSLDHKGYQCYDHVTHRLCISRDVHIFSILRILLVLIQIPISLLHHCRSCLPWFMSHHFLVYTRFFSNSTCVFLPGQASLRLSLSTYYSSLFSLPYSAAYFYWLGGTPGLYIATSVVSPVDDPALVQCYPVREHRPPQFYNCVTSTFSRDFTTSLATICSLHELVTYRRVVILEW